MIDYQTTTAADELQDDDIGLGVVGEADDGPTDFLAVGVFEAPGKHARLEVLRVIGARLREARELCRLPQNAAAHRMGCDPQKLARIEAATDASSVPLWLIRRAAEVYEVSVDFLFGFTDDWEVGARMTQEREVSAWLAKAWADARRHDVLARLQTESKIDAIRNSVIASMEAARELEAALERFSELNPEFEEDMRGGARLASAVENCAVAAAKAGADLRRAGLSKRATA